MSSACRMTRFLFNKCLHNTSINNKYWSCVEFVYGYVIYGFCFYILLHIHNVFFAYTVLCFVQVSWIRKRDLHILTVGILTYTNDQRFQAMHQEGSDEWTLKISSPQPRDSGTYECQVSMEPKISQAFRLVVIGE